MNFIISRTGHSPKKMAVYTCVGIQRASIDLISARSQRIDTYMNLYLLVYAQRIILETDIAQSVVRWHLYILFPSVSNCQPRITKIPTGLTRDTMPTYLLLSLHVS